MQTHQYSGRFYRCRGVPKIFGSQFRETKLILTRHLPQKIRIRFHSDLLRGNHQFRRHRRGKAQHHVNGFNLHSLAMLAIDLQSAIIVSNYRTSLKLAVFFIK